MILENCEIWFCKVHPNYPDRTFPGKSTWNTQLRTTNPAQVEEWKKAGLNVKSELPTDGSKPYWRVNVSKNTIKKDGTPAKPIDVVDAALMPIKPGSIGNGSIGNVQLFQFQKDSGDVGNVFMGLQIIKHIVYEGKPRESFKALAAAPPNTNVEDFKPTPMDSTQAPLSVGDDVPF